MKISLYNYYFLNFKFLKNFFSVILFKCSFFLKECSFLLFKNNYLFIFISSKVQSKFIKEIYLYLLGFFKGYCFKIKLEGKRFKFLINNLFIFFKMDISHFDFLLFKYSFFLKKYKRKKKFFFFTFENTLIQYILKKINKLKKPNKYKKKGIFLSKLD